MHRSVCLFIVICLGLQTPANAQNTLPVKPKQFQISDTSPVKSLSASPGSVTPASFLRSNQETTPSEPSGSDDIPSILTGKKRVKRTPTVQSISDKQDDKIDPLNIPSSPITPRKIQPLSAGSSGFQPRPSGFQPPKKTTQFRSAQPIGKPSSSGFRSPSLPTNQSPARNTTPKSLKSSNLPTLPSAKSTPAKLPNNPRSSAKIPPARIPKSPSENRIPSANTAPRIQSAPIQTAPTRSAPTRSAPTRSPDPRSNIQDNSATSQGNLTGQTNRPSQSVAPSKFGSPRVADRSTTNYPVNNNSLPINATVRNPQPASPDLFSKQQQSPQIRLISTGPRSIAVNKTGQFQVKVMNVGQIDASELMIGIEIPSWVEVSSRPNATGGEATVKEFEGGRGIVWNLSYLPAGRDALITLNLEPKKNRAFNLKTEWTTAPVSGEAKVMVTQAKLATRIAGPSEVKYGEKAVYTITIENTGNGNAEKVNVSLSENLGGDSAAVGLIEAGASKQFEVELTAGQAGPMKLAAMVKGDAGVNSSIAKDIVVRRAKLVVNATGPKFKYAGSAITYNISVANTGDAPAKNISAATLLPLNAEYISGLNQITQNDGRKIGWKIGEIPAGSKRDFIVTCLINQAGEAKMEVGIRAEDGLTSGGIVTTKVEALADLKLEVVDPRGPQAVGRQVTYELHIKNRGTKAARNVQISGEFSDFIDPVAGSGGKAAIEKGGIIAFAPIQEIGVGESVVIKIIAKASQPGTHTFRAIVQCKEQDIRKISEGTTKFFGDSPK